jgi:4-amino-4-deoxy-L-arabinose transferase-like glycosyltransferase
VAVLVYCIGTLASGRCLVGLVAGLLYACHPLAVESQVRAMADAPLAFFSCLSVMLLVWSFPPDRIGAAADPAFTRRRVAFLALGPVALGLAVGSKLTGLVVVLATVLSLSALAFWRWLGAPSPRGPSAAAWGLWGLAALGLTVGTSVAFNPTLYPAPFSRFREMLEHRWRTALVQRAEWPDDRLDGLPDKVEALYQRLTWDYPQIDRPWFSVVHLDLALFGLAGLVVREGRRLAAGEGPSRALPVLAWVFVLLVVLTPAMPLKWPRYYVPYLPAWELLTGFGLVFLLDGARALCARARALAEAR